MIRSFRSRALKRFWEHNDPKRLPATEVGRINAILQLLDEATTPQDLDVHGLHFHALVGNMRGRYSVTVRANWRITFAWFEDDATDVDYEDYH